MKEVGRKKINWDSIVTVELSLKELQLIRDAMAATDCEVMKNVHENNKHRKSAGKLLCA